MSILFWTMMIAGQMMSGHIEFTGDCLKAEKVFIEKFAMVRPSTGTPIAAEVHTLCLSTE